MIILSDMIIKRHLIIDTITDMITDMSDKLKKSMVELMMK